MASPMIWQNEDQSVILIDIPRSIEQAQGEGELRDQHILSCQPLEQPFSSQEPKSARARSRLEQKLTDVDRHKDYHKTITAALKETYTRHEELWCHPRAFTKDAPPTQKRKLDASFYEEDGREVRVLPENLLPTIATSEPDTYVACWDNGQLLEDTRTASNNTNISRVVTLLPLREGNGPRYEFTTPPYSSFYLGDCINAKAFRDAVRAEARLVATSPDFDFMLLDPPWPNSSIKRTHKTPGTTYSTVASMQDLQDMLLDTKIDYLMAQDCTVAVWITNKLEARDVILNQDRGLFACWNLELVEEWLWVKTTTHGEPVLPLDSLWRKPYEILLIGRRQREVAEAFNSKTVKRRVLVAVPDLHSRKPCLQQFLPILLPGPTRRRTLEVFARHLVEGWWSWGNECIKFNWDGYWRDMETQSC